jgi:LuxR family maltose regulon positive regulatory protein
MRQSRPQRPLIVQAKLRIPPRPSRAIDRDRLLERLRATPTTHRILISGPAGVGKTTFMADWCRARQVDATVVWLSVDEQDADSVRLWAHLIEGLSRTWPTLVDEAAAALASGADVDSVVLPLIVNALDGTDARVVLALDDLHKLGDREARESIGRYAELMPANLTLMTAGRAGPDRQEQRAIVHGDAVHLSAEELCFDKTEARRYLELATGQPATETDVDRVLLPTRGWIAPMTLLVGHIHDSDEVVVPTDDAGIAEYVYGQVTRDLARDQVDALTTLARVGRFTRALASEIAPAASTLIEPDRRVVVGIHSLGGGWYALHDLVSQALITYAGGGIPHDPLRVAAAWHERAENPEEAVELYARAAAWDDACRLLNESWPLLVNAGRVATLGRMLNLVPRQVLVADDAALVTAAWHAGFTHDLAERDRLLDIVDARESSGPLPDGTMSMEHAAALNRALIPGDYTMLLAAAQRAIELTPEDSPWYPFALMGMGTANTASGDPAGCRDRYLEAAARSEPLFRAATIGGAALAVVDLGDDEEASRLAAEAERIRDAAALTHVPWLIFHEVVRGEFARRAGDTERAIRSFEVAAAGLAVMIEPYPHIRALIGLARARQEHGDREGAADALAVAESRAAACGDVGAHYEGLLLDARRRMAERPIAHAAPLEPLTDRELAVLRLLATTQLSQSEIADELYVSRNTVKSHSKSIYRKLHVKSRGRAALRAQDLGLI